MKHYGTFERVSDVMKPFERIFIMIQPLPKRSYNTRPRDIYEDMQFYRDKEGRLIQVSRNGNVPMHHRDNMHNKRWDINKDDLMDAFRKMSPDEDEEERVR